MAAQAKPRINWADLYLMAESESSPFADVRIVTARSEYDRQRQELQFEAAMGSVFGPVTNPNITVRESVTVSELGELSVVINASEVSDDVMWTALDMVADAMYHLNGTHGTIFFSEPIGFEENSPVVNLC